jgi:hypothetical protein
MARRTKNAGGTPRFDVERILRENPLDMGRTYRDFGRDVAVLGLPVGGAILYPLAYLAAAWDGLVPVSWGLIVGQEVEVEGWFFRSVSARLGTSHLRPLDGTEEIDGYVHLAGYVLGVILLVPGGVSFLVL